MLCLVPPQHGSNPCHELTRIAGFRQVVVGSNLQPQNSINIIALGRQHHEHLQG
jgi:hypothetical protein